jgi:thiol-disulfide isomerase/thioredoxin
MAVWQWVGVFMVYLLLTSIGTDAQVYSPKAAAMFSQLDGKPFSEIVLEDSKDDTFNTASLKGKTIYIDFWFTQCPPCLHEIPFANALQQYFAADTNLVFVSICIENIERKGAWKKMVADKNMKGIHLFYARNRPQKINLLRQYRIYDFPTYLLVNAEQNIIGYNAPAPSQKGWVQWVLTNASRNINLAEAYRQMFTPAYYDFIKLHKQQFDEIPATQ